MCYRLGIKPILSLGGISQVTTIAADQGPTALIAADLDLQCAATGYLNETIGFGGSIGNNDLISIYGDSGNQTWTAATTQVSMTVGTQALVGNNMCNSYAYGQGG